MNKSIDNKLFQLSTLTNESQCRSCANCCKSLTIWILDTEDIGQRLEFISGNNISVRRTGIYKDEIEWLLLKLNQDCKHLISVKDQYSCSIWDSPEKPQLCRSYPSNQFFYFDSNTAENDPENIQQKLNLLSENCPALEGKTLEDIRKDQQQMRRSYEQ